MRLQIYSEPGESVVGTVTGGYVVVRSAELSPGRVGLTRVTLEPPSAEPVELVLDEQGVQLLIEALQERVH